MQFFKTIYKNEIVFLPNVEQIDDNLAWQIISNIPPKKRAGIDMSKVKSVNSKILIECLLNNKIKLFNLQSELLAYFALVLKDGFLKSYTNEEIRINNTDLKCFKS